MFNYLMIFGCGAITYLLSEKCSKKRVLSWYNALIIYIMYSMVDMASAYLILSPLGRITRIDTAYGITEISYGRSAIVVSVLIALLWGVVFGFLKKHVDVNVEISEK